MPIKCICQEAEKSPCKAKDIALPTPQPMQASKPKALKIQRLKCWAVAGLVKKAKIIIAAIQKSSSKFFFKKDVILFFVKK